MTVTRYEYDDDGRMVRAIAIPEPEWSRDDVAFLVASRLRERELGPHGIPMSEAMDPANEFAFVGQRLPTVDFAEKARKDAQDAYYKQYDKKDNPVNRNGHTWSVSRRPKPS